MMKNERYGMTTVEHLRRLFGEEETRVKFTLVLDLWTWDTIYMRKLRPR